ncbi:sortilin isoform X2 [Hyla sarda]|uniref:sortilin isoform X2 n=1 Tax=Hyla sarda TaxID=327740 RepID=UPI0024C44607|nr:sortilin isoform X2 [Hyla sarda]
MLTMGGAQQGAVGLVTNGGREVERVTSSPANKRLAVSYLSVCWLRLRRSRQVMGSLGGTRLRALLFVFSVCHVRALLPSDRLEARSSVWRRDAQWLSRVRRSAVPDMSPSTDRTCQQPVALQDVLGNETHPGTFDQNGELSLVWVGDGTGVILVLTTYRLPMIVISYGQSKLYRSEDYGKTFQDITPLIKNTYIRTEFGMGLGPENSDLPFHPLRPIAYNAEDPKCLMLISVHYDLWISKDFGENWDLIHKFVCSAKWGPRNMILLTTTTANESCSDWTGVASSLTMKRTSDFGKTFKVLKEHIHSFGLWGRFLLASVMEEDRMKRRIHVSQNHGDTWNVAQLPSVTHEQFYSVLAASDNLVFIHVDDEGDTGCGTIYTSCDKGIVYSKSLERHLYTKTGGDTDFTNVTSLRGVFITSVLSEDNSIYSVITFDQGGEWSRINKPENTDCDSTAKYKAKCSLHIHAQYSMSQNLAVPLPPVSESNAIGIVLAHGSVGDAVSVASPSVYLSDDGGYSWTRILDGPHHYAILDSGGLIVAIQQSDMPVNAIKFSTDEGQCWFSYNFSKDPLMFTGLASEPGARSLNVTVWGYEPGFFQRTWMSYTIDFAALLKQSCEDKDYTTWLAHSTDPGAPSDGCVLGYKEHYQRLKKSSMCRNGRDYLVSRESVNCDCTLDDYMCDFGYFRKENDSTCVEQPELKGHELDLCINGEEEKLTTLGYRKIPGDKCTGGINPVREEMDMKKKCTNDFYASSPKTQEKSAANSVPLILSVVVVLLVAVAAAVMIIRKYVCGGRFLVHRYSVLRQHADTHGDEHLDSNIGEPCRSSGYHDDSDEDLLE